MEDGNGQAYQKVLCTLNARYVPVLVPLWKMYSLARNCTPPVPPFLNVQPASQWTSMTAPAVDVGDAIARSIS